MDAHCPRALVARNPAGIDDLHLLVRAIESRACFKKWLSRGVYTHKAVLSEIAIQRQWPVGNPLALRSSRLLKNQNPTLQPNPKTSAMPLIMANCQYRPKAEKESQLPGPTPMLLREMNSQRSDVRDRKIANPPVAGSQDYPDPTLQRILPL